MKKLLTLTTALVMVGACAAQAGSATIINKDGQEAGTATLSEGPNGLVVDIAVEGLTPGKHGFHIHKVGTCEPHEHFTTASGHVNLEEVEHGFLNEAGYEEGDLPNLIAGEDGKAAAEILVPGLDMATLLDEDGSSFMIHENPDDHITQPIGGAGARVACGVIEE